MNLLQYAEDRKVEYTQLSKWAGQGRFSSDALRKEGRRWMVADAQELDRQVAAAKAPDRGGRGGAPSIDQALVQQQNQAAAIPSFAQSRAIREAYAARLTRLEFDQRSGRLVDKAELKLKLAKLHMAVRDSLRTIPDRVAPIVAAETDQAKIHAMLLKEIGQALEGLGSAISD
ncbi:MAG: hypothetical protein EBT79_12270 [Actinobacteria bacterium]|nr:hypothetical protein [Actinomycetota bacterium]